MLDTAEPGIAMDPSFRWDDERTREERGAPLEITALSVEGEIMALRHRDHPTFGVQFHPESVLTQGGHRLLRNFLDLAA
ncbi:hypothetical protein D3874_20910 [Oleomonas cavernae]|uniref:Glutamine amidotransferase domain-containing protein n=2 Tax=Oleomonas cavernae TaxID=2320859 RepID=A0A418WJG4_9PROT|nr:hypothetical protein D3874_20910 [Oleomonas cavernae]